ncbi:MAG: M14 family zinc carboxypeptidase [Patiriisocius sp.]|uniref:M14 family zinc carboxypeptidase n=1 Tax=Patiriisocius sp. TaxID=2822396 RepID=UPI003EF2444F
MKNFLLIAFLFVSFVGFSQQEREKFQRAKISYSQIEDLSRLESIGLPVDHGIHKKGFYVISEFSQSELQTARENGFQVDVLVDDLQADFERRNALREPYRNADCPTSGEDYATPVNFQPGSMGGYLTYQEVLDNLDQMRALYPNLISAKQNISTFLTEGQPDNSVTPSIGGNGIKWVKISDNPDTAENEPQILYSGIHHAREPISMHQLIFYMWYLLENYDTDLEVQSIVNNSELYFVPVVNPDGYLYNEKTNPNGGGFWRKNRKNNGGGEFGVDNNRNYEYFIDGNPNNGMWGGEGSSGNPNSDVYRGNGPFSEVENQAMKWFVEQHDFVMAFNNHSFGNLLLRPFGYAVNQPSPEETLFAGLGEELVSRNGFNNILSSELYAAAGDSDDFMYGTVGTHDKIYAYTPEIGPEFWPPSNQIIPLSKGMMYFNLTSSKMINNYASAKDTAPLYTGEGAVVNATFNIRRLGLQGNGNFTVTLNPLSSNIIAVGNPVAFSAMELLETQAGNIQYTLGGNVNSGDPIVYELKVNNGMFDTTVLVSKTFGSLTPIFSDPGDSVTDNFTNDGWGTTTSTFVSPSSSITDSPNGNYGNNRNEIITLSSPVDLTDATGANVTFYTKFEIESGFDYVQFEISTNNGNDWIPQCGKFTKAGSGNFQPQGQPLYDGNQTDWVLEEIDLSDYIGETIIARFQLRTDQGATEDGFYFDDLTFNIVNESTLNTQDVAVSNFGIYPNPVNDILNITTSMSNYTIEVYNVQGQLVASEMRNNGTSTFDYSQLASGLYIMRLTSEGASESFKVVKK